MFKKIFVLFFLLFSINSYAESINNPGETLQKIDNPAYFVGDIKVNKTDIDATKAREKAIFDGQRQAFNIILSRMGINQSNSFLVNDNEVSQALSSMQINNEKVSENSYSATLFMEFNPDYMKYILDKYNIGKFTGTVNSYLIIPILNENNNTFIWGKSNRWLDAFKTNLSSQKNIVLVNSNQTTKDSFDIKNINNPNFSNFKNIARSYNVNNIVLVNTDLNKDYSIISTKIFVLNKDETRKASLNYQIINKKNVNKDFSNASLKIIAYLNKLDNNQKQLNVDSSNNEFTRVFITISSIEEIADSENVLKNNKNVVEFVLNSLTKEMVTYDVKIYNNDLDNFISSLESAGVVAQRKDDGIYIYFK